MAIARILLITLQHFATMTPGRHHSLRIQAIYYRRKNLTGPAMQNKDA